MEYRSSNIRERTEFQRHGLALMRYSHLLTVIFLGFAFALNSCDSNTIEEEEPKIDLSTLDTYEVIQRVIFDANCVSCHVAGSPVAQQSGLVLTEDVSYASILDQQPRNPAARADDRVYVGSEGLASLAKSYLWEKINYPDQEHFFADHPGYFDLMPPGKPLTNGELKLFKEWVLAGAPKTGKVANVATLDDIERYESPEFQALAPPSSGIQFHLGPFEVQPNFEREFFTYRNTDHSEPIYINRIDVRMRRGSHHFLLYKFSDETPTGQIPREGVERELRDQVGNYDLSTLFTLQYHEFFGGTQTSQMNYIFPAGTALELLPGEGLDLNAHYVNYDSEAIMGEIYVNLHTIPASEVDHKAEILTLLNQNLTIPAGEETTIEDTFSFRSAFGDNRSEAHVFQLFSHAHKTMTKFEALVDDGPNDGELLYVAWDWEHPPILPIDPPLRFRSDQGIKIKTTYNNESNSTIRWGFKSTDEMQILFGYYY